MLHFAPDWYFLALMPDLEDLEWKEAWRRKRAQESFCFNGNSFQKAAWLCWNHPSLSIVSISRVRQHVLLFARLNWAIIEMLYCRRGDLCPQPPDDLIVHCSIIQICSAVLHHIVCDSFLNTPFSKHVRPQRTTVTHSKFTAKHYPKTHTHRNMLFKWTEVRWEVRWEWVLL